MLRAPLQIILLALLAVCTGSAAVPPRVLTTEQWRGDLRALAEQLPRVHRDAFHAISRERFEAEVDSLDARIPTLADHEVIVGLARIVASIGDGHTRLTLPEDPSVAFSQAHSTTPPPRDPRLVFRHLPLRFYLYDDGLFVQAAAPNLPRAVGARVVSIGGVAADSALERVRPLCHRDNEMGFRLIAPTLLSIPEVLHAVGLASDPTHATLAFDDTLGRAFTLRIAAPPQLDASRWIDMRRGSPLWLRHPERFHGFEYLERERALYLQINRVADAPERSIARLARELIEFAATHPVDKLAIDLRRNAGGDNTLSRGLVLALARDSSLDVPGRLFVLIGRGTFSAAVDLASRLEYWTNARFVGEPTGGSPSGYGDAHPITLPNSGLTVRISTIYWRDWSSDEHRPWVEPDLPVAVTGADARHGRDPVLEAVLEQPARPDPGAVLIDAADRGGLGAALLVFYRQVSDPRTTEISLEDPMNRLGRRLLERGESGRARVVFSASAHYYPRSARAQVGLGAACEALGDTTGALEAYRRAAAIDPRDPAADSGIERLHGSGAR